MQTDYILFALVVMYMSLPDAIFWKKPCMVVFNFAGQYANENNVFIYHFRIINSISLEKADRLVNF